MATHHSPILSIHALADDIRKDKLHPVEVLKQCLAAVNRYEPRVHAWVFLDREEARAQAEKRGEELRRGYYRGPLHGIPLGIKDIFDVFDWPTAAGSRLWAESIARRDATVVARLRQAGAIFLGKTVTTQYASFDPPPTRNPWDLHRTPGGSSSGSAAAVACGMCLGALGSQTGGSITRPASYCGVAGLKPTFGRVSIDGVVPLAPSMDHVGPIAGCVRDLAILLQVIAGADSRDPSCSARPVPDLLAKLDQKKPNPRLAVCPDFSFADPRLGLHRAGPEMLQMMELVVERFRTQGATVTEIALPAGFSDVLGRHRTIMAVEAAEFHAERLRRHPEDYLPEIRKLLEEGLAFPAAEYAKCREHQKQLSAETAACLQDFDALVLAATTSPAPDAQTTGDPAFNSPWSYTGLPVVSIPSGRDSKGLPLAIQLVGRPWLEAELLATADWCEKRLELERTNPPE
jgi:aspartyl-tRNA(Asn)/glutamyl-tRNA(Gln) amidotransferase subunit A